jgi:hypothetical protein
MEINVDEERRITFETEINVDEEMEEVLQLKFERERKIEINILRGQAVAFRVRFQYLTIYTPLNLYSFGFLVGPVRFVGFSFKTETEPDLLEFMILKIGLIGFLSRFGFFG